MIIKCFRCGKEIDSPNSHNADYVIANDMVVKGRRPAFTALKHTKTTLKKYAKAHKFNTDGTPKYPDIKIDKKEYERIELSRYEDAENIANLVEVVMEMRECNIQKTGVVCPECYRDTDFIIWGIHKGGEVTQ